MMLCLQVKMFAGSGWELVEAAGQAPLVQHPTDPNQRFSIVRVNEFDHARRTMSVVALDLQTGELHVFCKVCVYGCVCFFQSAPACLTGCPPAYLPACLLSVCCLLQCFSFA